MRSASWISLARYDHENRVSVLAHELINNIYDFRDIVKSATRKCNEKTNSENDDHYEESYHDIWYILEVFLLKNRMQHAEWF